MSENNNFPSKKQKLIIDAYMDNTIILCFQSLMAFGNFQVDNFEVIINDLRNKWLSSF